jgi:hypothetical protein
LSDADLPALGTEPLRYRAHAVAVREEYAEVPEDVFKPARAQVLSSLLEGQLFHTTAGRQRWEERARRNIAEEIAELTGRVLAEGSSGIASTRRVCDAPKVGVSYEEFAAEHRTQHLTPVNRWCAVVGNSLVPVAAVTALTGRVKAGATLFALANATLLAGHAAEGNLPRSVRDFYRHPIWGVRADVEVAVATVKAALG